VVVACGDSLFGYLELSALEHDLCLEPETYARRQRWDRLERRDISRYLQVFLSWMDGSFLEEPTIWRLVDTFKSSRCYDPRDRVFGLLALVHANSPTRIRPDYTKSVTDVVLQLIESKIEQDVDTASAFSRIIDASLSYIHRAYEFNFFQAFALIRDFYLRSDTLYGAANHTYSGAGFQDVIARLKRRRALPDRSHTTSQNEHLNSSLPFDDSRHFIMIADSSCRILGNGTGQCVAPLVRSGASTRDFRMDQEHLWDAISLQSPTGTVLAFVDGKTEPGDILLFLHNVDAEEVLAAPVPGLIVRPFKDKIYSVVGQFICDDGVKVCPGVNNQDKLLSMDSHSSHVNQEEALPLSDDRDHGNSEAYVTSTHDSECECSGGRALHNLNEGTWKVRMSPEDLLLFVAQDLRTNRTNLQPEGQAEPVVGCSVASVERARRLATSVTSELFSSYATLEEWRVDKGYQSLATVDEVPEFVPPWRQTDGR
jgi:hypothetical protein